MRMPGLALFTLTTATACTFDAGDDVSEALPRLELVEELRIDGVAEDLVPVGVPYRLAVAHDGTIALAQRQDNAIRFFGPDGSPLGSVGRQGGGPGEFGSINRIGWLADTLWVYDYDHSRFTLITPDRAVAGTAPVPREALPAPGEASRLPDRFAWVTPLALYPGGVLARVGTSLGQDVGDFDTSLSTHARVSLEGALTGVIARYDPGESGVTINTPNGGMMGTSLPIRTIPAVPVSSDGGRSAIATASLEGPDAGTFEVIMLDEHGDTVYARRYPFDPVPVPRAVADSLLDARYAQIGNADLAAAFRREARVPPVYPPIVDAVIGRDNTLWLRLRDTDEGRPYRVLDPAGEPVGRIVVPENAVVAAADMVNIWTLEQDEFDIESVVRYAVSPEN